MRDQVDFFLHEVLLRLPYLHGKLGFYGDDRGKETPRVRLLPAERDVLNLGNVRQVVEDELGRPIIVVALRLLLGVLRGVPQVHLAVL